MGRVSSCQSPRLTKREIVATRLLKTAPASVCEVLLPGTQRHDRVLKVPFYARAGVQHVWLVDPLAQTLEVLKLAGEHWLLAQTFGGTDTINAEPFEALDLPLGALWDRGEPDETPAL